MDGTVNIRNIQHFMYCPRRYALLEINRDWQENYLVAKADIMHENVHSGAHSFSDSRRTVRSSVALYNDLPRYDLYGVADCVEFVRSEDGAQIGGLNGRYAVRLVEYKPKPPKDGGFHESDAIQAFAQKICADYIWNCSSEAYIYYCETKKRVRLPFDTKFEKYDGILTDLLAQMRLVLAKSEIPPRRKGQRCGGCSVAELCFPKDKPYSVREAVMSMKGELP